MECCIFLEQLRFFAYHGVGAQEAVTGNEFTVDLRLTCQVEKAVESDNVDDTVSYADVYNAIRDEMEIPSRLLEHVAGRMVKRLYRDFPLIQKIDLKLSKRNPPMGADIRAAGVELHSCRPMQDAER